MVLDLRLINLNIYHIYDSSYMKMFKQKMKILYIYITSTFPSNPTDAF